MSSLSPQSDRPPHTFAEVNPTGDLASYKNSIAYSLGDINANVRHLTLSLQDLSKDLSEFKRSTETSLKDVKSSLKVIEDKVLVAETRVSSAVFTSKYFLVAVGVAFGWIISNWTWLVRTFVPHQ